MDSFIHYLKYPVDERFAKRIQLIKVPECQHKDADSEKNVKEDKEFELKIGREDTILYIEFRSVPTFQENRLSLTTKFIKPEILN